VNVATLQRFLRNLGEALHAADAKKVAADLDDLCAKMEPLKDRTLKDFSELVRRAAGIAEEAPPPRRRSAAKTAAKDPDRVPKAAARVRQLYDEAITPAFNEAAMLAEVNGLEPMTVAELQEVAKAVGVVRAFRKKADVLKAISQAIIERKRSHARADA
jgi:hypothetical protein